MVGALCHPAPLPPYGSTCRLGASNLEIRRNSPRQFTSVDRITSTCRLVGCRAAASRTNDAEIAVEVVKSAVKRGGKDGDVADAIKAIVPANDGRITKEVERLLHAVGKDRLEKVTPATRENG